MDRYRVQECRYPWYGGVGAASGVPMLLLRVQITKDGDKDIYDVIEHVRKLVPISERQRPRWAYLDTDYNDELNVHLRVHLRCNVMVVADGLHSLLDERKAKVPMYDHVVLRPKLPFYNLVTELFHSVVVPLSSPARYLDAIDAMLTRLGYNGPRYMSTDKEPTQKQLGLLCNYARTWRVTWRMPTKDPALKFYASMPDPYKEDVVRSDLHEAATISQLEDGDEEQYD